MQDYFLAGRSFFGGIANMDPMQMEPNTMEKRMLRLAGDRQLRRPAGIFVQICGRV